MSPVRIKVLLLTPSFPSGPDDPHMCFFWDDLDVWRTLPVDYVVCTPRPPQHPMEGVRFIKMPVCGLRRGPWETWRHLPDIGRCPHGLPFPGFDSRARALRHHFHLRMANGFLSRIIGNQKPDIVHSRFAWPFGSAAYPVCETARLPLVVTLEGRDHLKEPSIRYGARLNPYYETVLKAMLGRAQAVTVASTTSLDIVRALSSRPDRIRLVPNGVDVCKFRPVRNSSRIRRSLGVAHSKYILLSVGGLIERKGFHYIMHALPYILQQFPSTLLLLGGDGYYRPQLERLAIDNGVRSHVKFLGSVSRRSIVRYYQATDVFFLLSIQEGFGNVLIEAMACGKPVIGSNKGAMGDIIRNGRNGFIVDEKDAKDVAEKTCWLLGSERVRQQFGRLSREAVCSGYTLQHRAQRMYQVYGEVLEAQSP